jgi:hypothetical protein
MGDKLPRVRNDNCGLPGIIHTTLNVSVAATNIKTRFLVIEFSPKTQVSSLTRKFYPST